jgi:hypothetical protein
MMPTRGSLMPNRESSMQAPRSLMQSRAFVMQRWGRGIHSGLSTQDSKLFFDGVGAWTVQVAGGRSCPDPWGPKAQGTRATQSRCPCHSAFGHHDVCPGHPPLCINLGQRREARSNRSRRDIWATRVVQRRRRPTISPPRPSPPSTAAPGAGIALV